MSEQHDMQRQSFMPDEKTFKRRLQARTRRGEIGKVIFYSSIIVAIVVLITLFVSIFNEAFGTIAVEEEITVAELSEMGLVPEGQTLNDLDSAALVNILEEEASGGLRKLIRDELSVVEATAFTSLSADEALGNAIVPEEVADLPIGASFPIEFQRQILIDNLSRDRLEQLVVSEVIGREVVNSWPLYDTIFAFDSIQAEAAEENPNAEIIRFYSWLNSDFITTPMSSEPGNAGIRTALLGSIYMMTLVVLFSVPVGVGAAIYLNEYAGHSLLNRVIETNVRNLAAVPSIIYGLLGLSIFVRGFFVPITSGRTIISAALTLSLLILPIIIAASQEALRAVPNTIREASYGLGATKWQTIWRQVLPTAIPGILTGVIIAISRAVGETAPLIVVGAASFAVADPTLTSRFTALPIQVYQWTALPQDQFRDIAAAAIVMLLILNIGLNAVAIILRERYSNR